MTIIKTSLRTIYSLLVKVSPVLASKLLFYKSFRRRLDLKNPQTFNEKLMWLKLYEDDSLKTRCTDKYLVRNFVSQIGYSDILIHLYKVYDRVEEINFGELPNSFVMKCTHGSGFNIICSNKENLDQEQTILKLKKWMKTNYALLAAETHYSKIKPRIIVEKFLEGKLNGKVPIDYKVHCFHGEPQVIEVVLNRGTSEQKHIMLNQHWDLLPYNEDCINAVKLIDKPEKLDEILKISRGLSKRFTYVRVDLYFSEDQVYFGELTFTPAACLDHTDFNNSADYQIGKLLDLTVINKGTPSKTIIPGG